MEGGDGVAFGGGFEVFGGGLVEELGRAWFDEDFVGACVERAFADGGVDLGGEDDDGLSGAAVAELLDEFDAFALCDLCVDEDEGGGFVDHADGGAVVLGEDEVESGGLEVVGEELLVGLRIGDDEECAAELCEFDTFDLEDLLVVEGDEVGGADAFVELDAEFVEAVSDVSAADDFSGDGRDGSVEASESDEAACSGVDEGAVEDADAGGGEVAWLDDEVGAVVGFVEYGDDGGGASKLPPFEEAERFAR